MSDQLIGFLLGVLSNALFAALVYALSPRFRLSARSAYRSFRRAGRGLQRALTTDPSVVTGMRTVSLGVLLNGSSPYLVDLEHAFLAEAISVLEEHGVKLHVEREIGSATRDPATDQGAIDRICARFSGGAPDIFVTIGSGISTAVRHKCKDIPQIFLAVTDPVASGLVRSLAPDSSRGPVAGVTFSINAKERLAFICEVFHPRVLGFIHNPLYLADVHELAAFRDAAKFLAATYHIEIRSIECTGPSLDAAMQAECDVLTGWLYLHENMAAFVKAAARPIIGGGWVDLRMGACCCISDDEREMGRLAARRILIEFLLNRKPLALMPVYRLEGNGRARLFTGFNLDAAQRWQVSFPVALLDRAHCILQEQRP